MAAARRRSLLAGMLAAALPGLAAGPARARQVTLAGRMGERALLVVDGQPLTLAPGATRQGVRLAGWQGDEAEIELDEGGQRRRLRLRVGAVPSLVGAVPSATLREIVVTAGPGGHFTPEGSINGRPVRFIVDTGATLVALGRDEAQRLRLDLGAARPGISRTANGTVPVQLLTLARVRVGEVELARVDAVVMPQALPYVLLGNSFLARFDMRREGSQMRLVLR
jgi:aspartyl protease family protein